MTERALRFRPGWFPGLIFLLASAVSFAGYKARPWTIRARDSYPASLTSEGVTIAVDPLFKDLLAAQVFDKNDMVTRGIMPLAVVIFNDNDFPIAVDGSTIALIQGDEHFHTLPVNEVVQRLFRKSTKSVWIPQPVPRVPTVARGNQDALDDFDHKFLGNKMIGGHAKGGGFLYLQIPESKDAAGFLSKARLYIPEVHRQDTGAKMIFFEIDLKPAIDAVPAK
jgi:hypothetical protein